MHQFSFTIMTKSTPTESNSSSSPTMDTIRDANGKTIPEDLLTDSLDSPVDEFKGKEEKSHKDIIGDFAKKTSCHCLPRIIGAKSTRSRLFWSILFCTAIILFVFQSAKLISLYASFELAVTIDDGNTANISFPAVTVCNTNKLRLSKIEASEFSELAKTDPDHPETIHKAMSYQAPRPLDGTPISSGTCLPGDFMCADGQRCLKPHQRCDGYFQCWSDLSDEKNCTYPPCGPDEFTCDGAGEYGVCIHKNYQCDGIYHCLRGEDEEGCATCQDDFRCDVDKNGLGKCIPYEKRRDRFPDCTDRSDELLDSPYADSCGQNVTASPLPASLYSRRYPEPYDRNESCEVLIISEDDTCIAISFLDMNVETHKACENDYVRITDPKTLESVKLCGANLPDRWISTSNAASVLFRSDSAHHSIGFHLLYQTTPCPSSLMKWKAKKWSVCSEDSCGGGMRSRDVTCEPREDVSVPPKEREKGCPGIMPDRQETCNNELCSDDICRQEIRHCCTTINKLDGYRNGVNCAYSIVNRNGCVNITIMTMALPENEDCSLDYIKFADARKESLTKKFCGSTTATQEPALTWNSYSGIVNITFHSDGKKTGKEDGYVLIYDFVACGVWHVSPWSQCPVTCGEGTKFRQVQCRSRATLTVEPDSYCRGPKPPTTEQCVGSQPCEDPALLTRFSKNYDKSWCSQIAGRTIDAQICQEFFNLYRQTNKFAGVPYSSQIKWQDFLTFSSSQDYTDLRKLLKFNKNELAEFGHQLQDFVLQCSFNDEMCDIPSDFIQTQNDEYGNCYTYNHGQDGARLKYTNGEIVGTGLKLTLYIEQDEYVPFYGQDAGVRVLIHQPGITPFPEDYGVTVPPGKKAGIAIRRDSYIMKGSPFLDCIDQRDYRSIYGKESYYTTAVCHKSRVNLYIKELCGCADTIWLEKSGTPPCNIRQEEQERCRQFVRFLYLRGILKNDCKQSCRRIDYSSTMSLSQWPSNKHMGGLIKTLRPTNSKVPEKIDADSARDNLLKLEVSYEVPNSRSTISSPRYTFDQLIADIGGLFGLYLGISLITVVEFIEFLYDMYCYFISWKRVDERRLKKNRGNKMYDLAPSHSPDEFGTRV